jgi:hypothetical protein
MKAPGEHAPPSAGALNLHCDKTAAHELDFARMARKNKRFFDA